MDIQGAREFVEELDRLRMLGVHENFTSIEEANKIKEVADVVFSRIRDIQIATGEEAR